MKRLLSWSLGPADGPCKNEVATMPIWIVTSTVRLVVDPEYRRLYRERQKAAWERMKGGSAA